MQQAYRVALQPTAEQERFLGACAGASRFWFNQGLALVKQRLQDRSAGREVDVPWSYKGLCVAFRGKVKDDIAPWRSEVVIGSYQAGLESLGNALQNYWRAREAGRRIGFPCFRAKGRSHEAILFQRPRIADSRHVLLDRRLGPLRTKESLRKLLRLLARDPRARVLRSTVQRVNGGWTISFTVERSSKRRQVRRPNAVVGVDLGIARLATLSTGDVALACRPLQRELHRLRRLQRQLDRQRRANNPGNYDSAGCSKKGRRNWRKSQRMVLTEERIVRLHRRVANLRRERAHQLTTALVREFGVIGIETLSASNLIRNSYLARHIQDAGWGEVLRQLTYKASWSGGLLVAADRFYPSSKTCSRCGAAKAKLRLRERLFICENSACALRMDRDLNAAINLALIAQARAEAEGIPSYVARTGRFTSHARGGQVSLVQLDEHSSVKREASRYASQRGDAPAPIV